MMSKAEYLRGAGAYAARGVLLSLCLLLVALCDTVNGREREGASTEGEKMETMAMAFKSHGSIPPIDAEVPANTETATFALG
jgi:hypothetical protein